MRSVRVLTTLLLAGAMAIAAIAPVAAADSVGKASGWVKWTGQYMSGDREGRKSIFRVRDGTPGEVSRRGDRGWYAFAERNDTYDQSLLMRVRCARVDEGGDWAEFAGRIKRATGPNFQVGKVWLVHVLDLDSYEPDGIHIGMKPYDTLSEACAEALDDDKWPGRNGHVTGGRLDVWIK